MTLYKYYKNKCREFGLKNNAKPISEVLFEETFHLIGEDGEEKLINLKRNRCEEADFAATTLAPYGGWLVTRVEDGGMFAGINVWAKKKN